MLEQLVHAVRLLRLLSETRLCPDAQVDQQRMELKRERWGLPSASRRCSTSPGRGRLRRGRLGEDLGGAQKRCEVEDAGVGWGR